MAVALVIPTPAGASVASGFPVGGSLTRAESNADWTIGSIAGSVGWGPCSGTGAPGQLACLSVFERVEERPYCPPGVACPQWISVMYANKAAASALLSAPAPPLPSAPVNTERPRLLGTPGVGESLSCSSGAWEGSPTGITYDWRRDVSQIASANGTTYVVKGADQGHLISCEVTATNEGGSTSARSNYLEIPTPPPSIESQFVTDVSHQNATLNAVINPNGFLTKYMLQIDTTGNFNFDRAGCILHPPRVFCGANTIHGDPLPPGLVQPLEETLPPSNQSHRVSVDLASIGATLQPNTTYYYRAIAANGPPLVEGPTQTFTTLRENEVVIVDKWPKTPDQAPPSEPPAAIDPTPPPAATPPAPTPRRHQAKGARRCKRKPAHRKVCLRLSGARGSSR